MHTQSESSAIVHLFPKLKLLYSITNNFFSQLGYIHHLTAENIFV